MNLSPSRLHKGSEIRGLKPGSKPYAARFGNGLYLQVTPAGTKSWQVRYRVDDKPVGTIIGRWPGMSLDEAKAKREAMRLDIRAGVDPVATIKAKRIERREASAATFEAMAGEWIALRSSRWSANYRQNVPGRLRLHVFPVLGGRPIAEITKDDIRQLIGDIAAGTRTGREAPSMAVHCQQHIADVFDYAMAADKVALAVNPVRSLAKGGLLPTRDFTKNEARAHVATIEGARRVLALVEQHDIRFFRRSIPLVLGHRFLALTHLRKMEVLDARWSEFDNELTTWTIPSSRMKTKREHVVPLAPQAADVLRVARTLQASDGYAGDFVFKSRERGVGAVNGPALNVLMTRALAGSGIAHTPHGWRYTFSTLMNESDHTMQMLVEAALAHQTKGKVERIYNKAVHVEPRRLIECAWADMLLADAPSVWSLVGLSKSADVIQLRDAA